MNSPFFPRCQIIPRAGHQVEFQIDGQERLRWHFGEDYPRPFFYPVIGPSGISLTRMGHPGAENHEHHRSVWFAHAKVLGIDFWSDNTPAVIRQKYWMCYEDGEEAIMAAMLGWYDGHDPRELIQQELIAAVRPLDNREFTLELQSTFTPIAASLELGQTNFGMLAVRVAKHISEHFGGGKLTSSTGAQGEPAIFGKPAEWMDYSGPSPDGTGEGITCFDHPANPGSPTKWHVREDGWMGASLCMDQARVLTRDHPLKLRYLLHIHSGAVDSARAGKLFRDFAERPPFLVRKSQKKHQQYEVARTS